jgi:murein DD-endopeptidase MepM/ murein hydrolase activator NlpD
MHFYTLFTSPKRRFLAALTVCSTVPLTMTATAQSASAASLETWDKVAACESSGDWTANTNNGFYGGLQFTADTWKEFDGHDYAAQAHLATKEQQIAVAEKVLAEQGPGAWPVCSVRAGLTADKPGTGEGLPAEVRDAVPQTSEPGTEELVVTQEDNSLGVPSLQAISARAKGFAPVAGGFISTAYKQPGPWVAGYHTGVDFAVPTGTSVKAITSGTVVSAKPDGAYGNAVVIQHDDGCYSLYAHLSKTLVGPGDKTKAGQEIGLSGNTGNSTGPHLHLEVRTSNSYDAHIDPIAYLRSLNVTP